MEVIVICLRLQQSCITNDDLLLCEAGGWPYEKEEEWRARSAVTNASKLSAPLLIQHGMDDLNVPYAQIVEFVDAAKRAEASTASVTFYSYEGEKHGNQKPENQEAYLRRTAEFFCEHLMPWNSVVNPGEETK